jgi:hypothetical protein
MQKEYLKLVKNALARGLTVSVYDGYEWDLKRSSSYQAIKNSIEDLEMAELRLRDQEGRAVGWAMVIPDLEPDETVADCTHSELMCELLNWRWEQ